MSTRRGSKRTSRGKKFLSYAVLSKAAKAVAKIDPTAAIAGGYGLTAFGSRRLTGDLDVLSSEVPDGVKPLRSLSFGGVRTNIGGVPTDFIVRNDEVAALYEAARASAVKVPGYPLRVVQPEYMVSLKLYAGRPKDHGDIETIFGWDIDRKKTLAIAGRYLGIMAIKDLEQMMAISDWKRSRNLDEDE